MVATYGFFVSLVFSPPFLSIDGILAQTKTVQQQNDLNISTSILGVELCGTLLFD